MKAWLLDKKGAGVDSLRLTDSADPTPAAGEVVLNLSLAALNPADRYLAEDQYPAKPAYPHILGRDGVGVVSAIGPGVSNLKIGDKRIIVRSEIGVNRRGTFAQKVAVPVESLVEMPPGWSDEQAAGATLVYLTAWQAITQWPDFCSPPSCSPPVSGGNSTCSPPVPGGNDPAGTAGLQTNLPAETAGLHRTVLVSGASGGVGVAVAQLASALGHTVVGLSRSKEKSAQMLSQGCAIMLDPHDPNWPKQLKEKLGRRVDLAVDNIGGELFSQMIDTLAQDGRMSCVGRLAGEVPQFNTASLFFRRIQIRGVAVYTYKAAESAEIWPKIVRTLERKNYQPLVDSTHDFANLRAAFERLKAGPMGKVLIRVRERE